MKSKVESLDLRDPANIVHVDQKRAVCKEKFRVLQQLVADRSKLFHAGDLTVVSQVINDFSVQGFNINDFRHMDFVYADAALQYQTGIAVFGSGTHDVIQSFNQPVSLNGFHQVIGSFHGITLYRKFGRRRQENNVCGLVTASDLFGQFDAVQSRHHHIQQINIIMLL